MALTTACAFPSSSAAATRPIPASQPVVVALFGRTAAGVFVSRGSGFVAPNGHVITSRDHRRYFTDTYARVEGSQYLLAATPVVAKHPTHFDVYKVSLPASMPRPEAPAVRGVSIGDRVVACALELTGATRLAGKVTTQRGDTLIEVAFISAPSEEQIGGPVLAADNSVIGILTGEQTETGGQLVLPVALIVARIEGRPERVTPVLQTDPPRRDPPPPPSPMKLPDIQTGDPKDVRNLGTYGTGSGAGTAAPGPASGAGKPSGGYGVPPDPRVVTKAKVLNNPRPAYTELARDNGTQGRVVVRLTLGANGRVKSATVVQGLPDGLNDKAIEAAYRLAFEPARDAAGQAIDSIISVAVNFTIGFRRDTLTGIWIASDGVDTPAVQFWFPSDASVAHQGLGIFERGPGVFACVPVARPFGDGVFEVRATVTSEGCSWRWFAPSIDGRVVVEEVRSCGKAREPARRAFSMTKIR